MQKMPKQGIPFYGVAGSCELELQIYFKIKQTVN